MKELPRSLRLFFTRELDRVEAVVAFFRGWRRLRPGRSRDALRTSEEARAALAQPPPRRRPRLRELLERRSAARIKPRRLRLAHGLRPYRKRLASLCGPLTVSLALHAFLLAALVLLVRPQELRPRASGERTVLVYLLPPPPEPTPSVPLAPPKPPVRPQEAPVVPAPEPGESPEDSDPDSDRPEGDPETPREGEAPELRSERILDRSPHSLVDVPLPIGLGASASTQGIAPRWGGSGFPRRGEGKGAALLRFGGGDHTEDAVKRGLRWLARHQDSDGGWSAEGFQRHCGGHVPCAGRGIAEFDVGVTALATLAFLGAGYVPSAAATESAEEAEETNLYGNEVARALEYLLQSQDPEGFFGVAGQHYLYNHSLATFAVAEGYAVTRKERYRASLEQAVASSLRAQQTGGGWDYMAKPSGRNDLSITGWQVMALRSASSAGVEVSESALNRVRYYLRRAVTPQGEGIYCDLGQEKGRRGVNMVAVGLLSHLYVGSRPEEPALRAAVERLLRRPPDSDAMVAWDRTFESYYYWYTATLALFHVGGAPWKAWNVFLLREILPLQSRKPHEDGSWSPEMNWIGVSGGRVYATAINVLTLETYYRYEPLYEARSP